MTSIVKRREAMIWGSFVADAASMGFHWLYDQKRIRDLAPVRPEFRTPSVDDFDGVPGFFAHPTRRAGDQSQYGEQALVMLRAINKSGGYSRNEYIDQFQGHFGYGGEYVGYIDRATRDTLENIVRIDAAAREKCAAIDPSLDQATQYIILTKVTALSSISAGPKFDQALESAVRETHDDDDIVAYALKVAEVFNAEKTSTGSLDVQAPAISKLPALIACLPETNDLNAIIEDAVRVTHNNEISVQFASLSANLLMNTLSSDSGPNLNAISNEASDLSRSAVVPVLERLDETTEAVTADIGMSCNLDYVLPSIFHNLSVSKTYVDGVRTNIYSGGDNCGRSIVLGAALGAIHGIGSGSGIPIEWIDKLTRKDEIQYL